MSTGDYNLMFEDRGAYLYARLTGKDSFAASLSYWHEIADKANQHGSNRLLVHESLEGEVSEDEIFEIMTDVAPAGVGVRVAFFDENQDNHALNELGELIATNRGAIIKIFPSLSSAEEWIVSDD